MRTITKIIIGFSTFIIISTIGYGTYNGVNNPDSFWFGFWQNFYSDLLIGIIVATVIALIRENEKRKKAEFEKKEELLSIVEEELRGVYLRLIAKLETINTNMAMNFPFLDAGTWRIFRQTGIFRLFSDNFKMLKKIGNVYSLIDAGSYVEKEYYKIYIINTRDIQIKMENGKQTAEVGPNSPLKIPCGDLKNGYTKIMEGIKNLSTEYDELELIKNVES